MLLWLPPGPGPVRLELTNVAVAAARAWISKEYVFQRLVDHCGPASKRFTPTIRREYLFRPPDGIIGTSQRDIHADRLTGISFPTSCGLHRGRPKRYSSRPPDRNIFPTPSGLHWGQRERYTGRLSGQNISPGVAFR